MTVFDLLFLAAFLTAAGALVLSLVAVVRGRRTRAALLARRVGIGAVVYFSVLLVVSAFTPQRYLGPGSLECSDDWCIAVHSFRRDTSGTVVVYDLTFQLASRARRVAQRERFVTVYLLDDRGRQYFPLPDPGSVPFDTLLQAGQTLEASRRFRVPSDARLLGVIVSREGGGRFPGCCIIGDAGSLFHRPTILKLD